LIGESAKRRYSMKKGVKLRGGGSTKIFNWVEKYKGGTRQTRGKETELEKNIHIFI